MSRSAIILLVVTFLIVLAAGYLLFGRNDEAVVSPDNSPATSAEVTFLALTDRIDPVEFDTSIISDPRFMRLQDIRTNIVNETQGRADPFAPLGR